MRALLLSNVINGKARYKNRIYGSISLKKFNLRALKSLIFAMDSTLGTLIVAALFIFGIYKGINFLFSLLPDSSFRTFMLSASGKVLTGFISPIVFYALFVFVAINILHIHC
ncbi:hypothetical protein SAMN05428947_104165 [Mucilaginibacter sp. OK283]|jgi:hypothetical protein|nr:hypothetical protein SAMN05428947_104165 [Mucilaginibacter sp. OK283]